VSSDENKELVRRSYEELINRDNLAAAGEYLAPDVVYHAPGHPEPFRGLDEVKAYLGSLAAAYSDRRITVEEIIGEGDTVAARYVLTQRHTGKYLRFPPTGLEASAPVHEFLRISDGKIQEIWLSLDIMGLMQDLGIMPPVEKMPPGLPWLVVRAQQLGRKLSRKRRQTS
jgi:ketosteroid isomerase-like protein